VRERLARKGLPEELFAKFPRLLFRDIARNDDERTLLACLAPPGFVSTYDTPMIVPVIDRDEYPMALAVSAGAAATFVVDFLIRPFVDKHIKGYTLSRVPWPDFSAFSSSVMSSRQVAARVIELAACQHPMDKFVSEFGWPGVRYRSDEERRWFIMRELDAAFFHQFLPIAADGRWDSEHDSAELRSVASTPREAVALVMDSFPIVARKDEQAYGNFRTRQTILQIFDEMTRCRTEGREYVSPLDPPPGPPLDEDGNPSPLEDVLTDPPPHIHLSDELLSKAQVLHLGDLVRVFPPTPFRLQMGTASGARRVQVTPTPTAELVNGTTVAMAYSELRVHGQPVAVAFGVLAIEQRTDANTGQPFVHVTIRGEAGTVTARLTHHEWRDMTTIGVVDAD